MKRIIDQYGIPIDSGKLETTQTAEIGTLRNAFLTPMLGGLSPANLASILRAADQGNLYAQHRLFSDMEERDAHLSAEINKRKSALLCVDWDIVPPRNASAAEQDSAAWCKEIIEDGIDDFEDLLLACMDGVGHGFSAIELSWRKEGNEILPAFFPRPQEWFKVSMDRQSLRLIDQSADGQALNAFGWIMHQHGKAKTGYIGRLGLYRVLLWPFLYKSYAVGDFAEFLEAYGLPIIVGKYLSGASDAEKTSLMAAVTALGHDARAIMPYDMSIEMMKVQGGSSSDQSHLSMVDWADKSISKCILGATLTSQSDGKTSTNALGKVHDSVRHDILESDARQVAGTITRDLIYPLLALNRIGVESLRRCPRLVFDVSQPEDLVSYSDSLAKLAPMMQIPVSWVREKLHIPAPEDGDEVLSSRQVIPGSGKATPAASTSMAALASLGGRAEKKPVVALAERLQVEAADAWNDVVKHVEALVYSAESMDGLQAALLSAYDGLPLENLRAVMGMGFMTARLAGLSDVADEAGKVQ